MGIETIKRLGKLYKEGKLSEQYAQYAEGLEDEPVAEPVIEKTKSKRKK